MNKNEIIQQRLWNQLISKPQFNTSAEVVSLGLIFFYKDRRLSFRDIKSG